jgi:hypothetical protein
MPEINQWNGTRKIQSILPTLRQTCWTNIMQGVSTVDFNEMRIRNIYPVRLIADFRLYWVALVLLMTSSAPLIVSLHALVNVRFCLAKATILARATIARRALAKYHAHCCVLPIAH